MTQLENYQKHDIETLKDLFTNEDFRTVEEMRAEDTTAETSPIASITLHDDGKGATVTKEDSWSIWIDIPEDKTLKEGDEITLYGGLGHPIYGVVINGEVWKYLTPFERYAERLKMLADHDRERRDHYEARKALIDKWYEELSEPYKARVDRHRSEKANFDFDGGDYELCALVMSDRIQKWIKENHNDQDLADQETVEGILKLFRSLPHEDQKSVISKDGDTNGCSGWQFESACGLAGLVVLGRDI